MPYLDESWIDDPEELARRDSRDSLRALATAGAQVREAVTLSQEGGVDKVAYGERPRSVVVAALGGSALVADVLELLAEPSSPVPVTVRRNLPLPGWWVRSTWSSRCRCPARPTGRWRWRGKPLDGAPRC